MKTKIYLLFLSLLFFSIGCDKEKINPEKLEVIKINFTGCLNDSKKSDSSYTCLSIQAIENKYLKIQHFNSLFCCGTEEFDIQFELNSDTIIINEIDLGPFTYCFCNHDVEFEIGPLSNESYYLKLIDAYKKDSIFINFQYSDTLNFTNCN